MARQPLLTAGYESSVDVHVRVHGGGIAGQAGAVRHGIARALTEIDPELRPELKRRGLLTRDARKKERRKAGLKKARKRPQFSQALAALARRLFGTDGVRGVAGELLTAELALALGPRRDASSRGRRAPAGADRPRHARVRADARGGARRRRRAARAATRWSPGCCRRRPPRSSSAGSGSTSPS